MNHIYLAALLAVLLPTSSMAEDSEKVQIVTGKGDVAHCLAPVQIRMIDGKLRQLPSLGFDLEPGMHILAGNPVGRTSHCNKSKKRSRKPIMSIPAVEWLFEPGKKYYLAVYHDTEYIEDWRLVVWKVETEDGELVFDITDPESQ
ncbi:MAG: hypothetical protein HKN15_01390 [Xanthomonadales bacterium]|nr:hypothetical protein [Xanthomonadales bacterium]